MASTTHAAAPLRILATFALPPPSMELLLAHPAYPGVPLEIITAEGDMEVVAELHAQLKKHAPLDGLICRPGNTVNKATLDLCGPSLRAISTFSVGFNHIDLVETKVRNILVGHCPNTVTHATADLTLALVLATARLVVPGHENVVKGQWGTEPFHVYTLAGQDVHHSTVGIVGLGRIGLAVAKRLRGFDCKILYTGRTPKPELAAEVGAEFVSFDELLARSDFVLPHCPLNAETKHLFNREAFSKMKPTAIFVNTTRGGIVDQDALHEALRDGVIFAAGLDVTDPEPFPASHPLVGMPNCLILPHVGTATKQCRHETAAQTIANLMEALTTKDGGRGIYCNKD